MSIENWVFIALGNGREDDRHRAVVEFDGLRSSFLVASDPTNALHAAQAAVAAGAQTIELCGAFTASDVAALRAGVDASIPIGVVSYGADSVVAFAELVRESAPNDL